MISNLLSSPIRKEERINRICIDLIILNEGQAVFYKAAWPSLLSQQNLANQIESAILILK